MLFDAVPRSGSEEYFIHTTRAIVLDSIAKAEGKLVSPAYAASARKDMGPHLVAAQYAQVRYPGLQGVVTAFLGDKGRDFVKRGLDIDVEAFDHLDVTPANIEALLGHTHDATSRSLRAGLQRSHNLRAFHFSADRHRDLVAIQKYFGTLDSGQRDELTALADIPMAVVVKSTFDTPTVSYNEDFFLFHSSAPVAALVTQHGKEAEVKAACRKMGYAIPVLSVYAIAEDVATYQRQAKGRLKRSHPHLFSDEGSSPPQSF